MEAVKEAALNIQGDSKVPHCRPQEVGWIMSCHDWAVAVSWSLVRNAQQSAPEHCQRAAALEAVGMFCITLLSTSTLQIKKIEEVPPHCLLFVFEGHSVLHYHTILAMMYSDTAYVALAVYCVVLCFPFCWITIWCGNCMEPQIITAVETVLGKTHFLLFLWQLSAAFFFAPFCFFLLLFFTPLLCVSLRSLCS